MLKSRHSVNRYIVLAVIGVALVVLSVVLIVLAQIRGAVNERLQVQFGTPAPPLVLSDLGGWRGTDRVTVLLMGIDQRPGEDPATARTAP
jgi:hypothetical protein